MSVSMLYDYDTREEWHRAAMAEIARRRNASLAWDAAARRNQH